MLFFFSLFSFLSFLSFLSPAIDDESTLLKEVDVLEERARESMGARQYSELRTSIARPEREPSTIAHLLVMESPDQA